MNQVTEQKGIASSTPSALRRWFLSRLMSYLSTERRQMSVRSKRERKRRREKRRHTIEYFHQVDDGYSHLAIQVLQRLQSCYNIDLKVHIAPALRDDNFPEPDLWKRMARNDAAAVAPYYGLDFPMAEDPPAQRLCDLAAAVLSQLDADQFASLGVEVSAALWRGDEAALFAFAEGHGAASEQDLAARLNAAAERRRELKHYGGAMFWYEGEWYWGVDRLYHLEARLRSLDALEDRTAGLIAPRPAIPSEFPSGARDMTLEYYASLRSPYTAVSWGPTMRLAAASGINLKLRPVLPMVMRGVPATFEKAVYVFTDAAREARAVGVDYGNFYDPIGDPIKYGYSIYMWAESQGKGLDFFEAFLKAAFAQGVNTNTSAGLRQVVENAEIDWMQAKQHLVDDSWADVLEENRLSMYGFGSWGVPSYRLLNAAGEEVLGVWGQDRLWLVAHKIAEQAS